MPARNIWSTYLSHAFHNVYNYGALGLCLGLSIIFREPGLLLLGSGLELAYLYILTTMPRYHRHIDSLLAAEKELRIDELRKHLWPLVGDQLRARYEELSGLADRLDGADIKTLSQRDPFFIENKRKVNVLLATYLKLAVAVTRYGTYLAGVEPTEIKKNMERLKEEAKDANERVKKVKLKNIEILQKRLNKVTKAETNKSYLAAQMETIEDSMSLVVDQAITMSDPKGMGLQIDNLLLNLQETELIAEEMESFIELEAGLDDDMFILPRQKE